MSVKTAKYQVEWKPAGSWVDITSSVLTARGGTEITGNRDNALAFGDSSDSQAEFEALDGLASTAWARTPVRITYTVNGVAVKAFAGIITGRKRGDDGLSFDCVGYADLVRATKAYSLPYSRRPVATKTTAASVEDPSNTAWRAGLINWIFWNAGGRPLEQNSNPTYAAAAKFWYSCDQAALAPTWSWVEGEDGWAEAQKLAQASGGQVFQSADGTVMYRQPYGYADATALYTFNESTYLTVDEEQSAAKVSDSVRCSFIQRDERPMQKVAEDSTPQIIYPGNTAYLVVEPSWPITTLELKTDGLSLVDNAVQVTFGSGEKALPATHYGAFATVSAKQINVEISNQTIYPLQLWGYVLRGRPIMASEGGSVIVGSGVNQRTLDDNPYIQTEAHARRLASLYLKYYAAPRPVRGLSGCDYDPARYVGEVVNLTVTKWGIVAQPHVILSIEHDDTGLSASYKMAYVGDLPKNSDYFQVGPSYVGQSKKITV